jgi:hypothetical protein
MGLISTKYLAKALIPKLLEILKYLENLKHNGLSFDRLNN